MTDKPIKPSEEANQIYKELYGTWKQQEVVKHLLIRVTTLENALVKLLNALNNEKNEKSS